MMFIVVVSLAFLASFSIDIYDNVKMINCICLRTHFAVGLNENNNKNDNIFLLYEMSAHVFLITVSLQSQIVLNKVIQSFVTNINECTA